MHMQTQRFRLVARRQPPPAILPLALIACCENRSPLPGIYFGHSNSHQAMLVNTCLMQSVCCRHFGISLTKPYNYYHSPHWRRFLHPSSGGLSHLTAHFEQVAFLSFAILKLRRHLCVGYLIGMQRSSLVLAE